MLLLQLDLMFKDFWKKITNRGVTADLDFNVRNKIRIFNSSIFIIGSIYLFYTMIGFLRGHILAGSLTFVAWVISAFCLYLMSQRRYTLAYHITAILGIVFLFTFSLLYGETNSTHIFFFFIPVGALVLLDDFKACFIYFLATVICLISLKILFLFYPPYYPAEDINKYLGFLNIFMTCSLLFLAVRMFKYENLIYSKEISHQRDVIEEANKDILSSIHYAKRIQKALLASDSMMKKNLQEHFVLYKPKDIVSGDFYWGENVNNKFLLCTADCTGHGVPGAFMSLLGISFLNETVKERKIIRPDLIFNQLREDIIHVLNPEGTIEEGKDGMDAVLCCFDFQNMTLEFACANNPLWIIRENKLLEFKPDKQPIGMYEIYEESEHKQFTLQTVQLQKGDLIYTFTDGYADQFGGEKGKKFKYKHMQETLLEISKNSMEEQSTRLNKIIEDWKGSLDQVDDILMIGIRV
ncbi:MAG: PP2C family protein-serine/threonine phosphatase [Bacteroidia bacterium]